MSGDKGRDRESERGGQRRMRDEESDEAKRRAGLWMVFFLGAAAIGNMFALRRRLLNIERQSAQGNSSRQAGEYGRSGQSDGWSQSKGGSRAQAEDRAAQEAQRQWQAQIDEQLRRERIRRMQEAFARERGTYTHNTWHERHGDKWDWRWEGDRWEWKGEDQRQQAQREQDWKRNEERKHASSYELLKRARLAHHFSVLGLDATRPHSDADIKAAFRSKAMEYHPDQNQGNKQVAEVKFRQLLESYHLLKGQLKVK